LVKARIEKINASYEAHTNKHRRKIVFQPGGLVWIHLRKNKLMPRAEGPFKVLERINDNAYKADLLKEYGVSATFNVADLSPFHSDDSQVDLRIKSFQQGEDDGVLPSQELVHDESSPDHPRTRSQVQKMALLLQETQTDANGFKIVFEPNFVFLMA